MEDSNWESHLSPMMMGAGHSMSDMGGHSDISDLGMSSHHPNESIEMGHNSMDSATEYYAHQLLVSSQTTIAPGSSPGSGGGSLSPGATGALSPGGVSSSNINTPVNSAPCCDTGRPLATDPVTGQSVCSCQYDPARLSALQYSRGVGVYGTPYPSTDQNPYPSIGVESSAFYSPLSNPYGLKDASTADMSAWTSAGLQPTTGYYPYDPTLAAYGYGAGYDLAARRKNATRESTATLKAWLNEHKKNPYPTKGEKIMLAIITKMTLTQVSTWFANARRRLKKENKMTWEPKNKTDDDDDALVSDGDDKDKDDDDKRDDSDIHDSRVKSERPLDPSSPSPDLSDRKDDILLGSTTVRHILGSTNTSTSFSLKTEPKSDCGVPLPPSKPKIWSLADTAACKTPPPPPQWGTSSGTSGFALPTSRYANFSCNSGFADLQADTPPQTPPNLKVPSGGTIQQNQANCLNYGTGASGAHFFNRANEQRHMQGLDNNAPTNNNNNNNGSTAAAFKPFYKSSQGINGGFVSPV